MKMLNTWSEIDTDIVALKQLAPRMQQCYLQ